MTDLAAVDKAIAIIEECRQSHVEWADHLDELTAHCDDCGEQARAKAEIAGDREHHRLWVENYDAVLAVLKVADDD